MIIRSVRLKNIKSYGDGDTDTGIIIDFEPGVNRIAGRNGHGKSTLIEAIGYALFLAKPDYAENFKVETYLLRDGAKEGEIDVTFEHRGTTHRIERGVGKKSKRRTKIIDRADESICAEGDREVEDFLCRYLDVPSAKHLNEIFTKLVGVKQGRLTRPFDSKGAEARNFFEPLFDVAIFKECRDKLKPAKDHFDDRLNTARIGKAGIDQRVADRADSREKLALLEKTLQQQQVESETAVKSRDAAKAETEKHERFRLTRSETEKGRDQAKNSVQLAANQRSSAKERLDESEQAVATAKKTLPAHQTYLDAEQQLKALEKLRLERDALKDRRNTAEHRRKERKSSADNAQSQAESFSKQKKDKSEELEKKDRERAALRTQLADSQLDYETAEKAFAEADKRHSELQIWISSLSGSNNRIRAAADEIVRLEKELSAWKPEALKAAEEAHSTALADLKAANIQLAEARERQATLKAQLDQISGGVCPFLKETCQQFDPAKVQADLTTMAKGIENGLKRASSTEKAAEEANKTLDALRHEQAQLKPKQASLESASVHLLEDLQSLLPIAISEAIERLRTWDPRIESLPHSLSEPETLRPRDVVTLVDSVTEFIDTTQEWWQRADRLFEEREATQIITQKKRARDHQTLEQLTERTSELTAETKRLGEEAQTKSNAAKTLHGEAAEFQKQLAALDQQLKAYDSLDANLTDQRQRQEAHRKDHERYLKAKDLASALEIRRKTQAEADSTYQEADNKLKAAEQIFAEADKAFDPEALSKAVTDYEAKSNTVATLGEKLNQANEAKSAEERRFHEWETACKNLLEIEAEIHRLEASIEITDLARKVLQNAAPTVAQHLCDRIAGRAQSVFNQINPDPIELSWEAKQYSVRIVPGDRRFAMLSGGEQTKLALALTLAMIEEFGGLRFCIFDEPTYGVDADSRQKLADAIIEAQSAANLEQLLLVSHDDAFEGKIEHAILLTKSAGTGSRVAP